jgi:SAM-dependent methyltransferase
MSDHLPRNFGRQAFGVDPANYDASRPAYPDWVFETLAERGLGPGAAVFEIGPGTGTATRRLLASGADPVVAIEPDPRLADYLRARSPSPALHVQNTSFEDADIPAGAFDLGLAATSFHWLTEDTALARIATLLKPGGWWAAVWNIFGDRALPDPFHDATDNLLNGPGVPPPGPSRGEQTAERLAALSRAGFEAVSHQAGHWPLVLTPDETVRLYATYSNIQARSDRDEVLAGLRRIAEAPPFSGRVVRNMITALYLARRPG